MEGLLINFDNLSSDDFDNKGDKLDGCWSLGEKRGNRPYIPPIGWEGFGLNINKYGEDKTWIGNTNAPGEWPVAYHGVGHNNVIRNSGSIIKNNLKPGRRQAYSNEVGTGVYVTPSIKVAELYADGDYEYLVVFMCRVNPASIREVKTVKEYWVVDGNSQCIRPYRILIKKR